MVEEISPFNAKVVKNDLEQQIGKIGFIQGKNLHQNNPRQQFVSFAKRII